MNNEQNKGAKMTTVYSSLSNDKTFPIYGKRSGDNAAASRFTSSVLIKGGANVVNKRTHEVSGFVATELAKEDYDHIKDNPQFKRLLQRGFLSLTPPKEPKKDKSAQLTDTDIKAKMPKVKIETNEPSA